MKFEKIQKKNTLEQAIDSIRKYIVNNKLKEGDNLPPETELADALGISRNILREALRHYRTLGIIGSKPKTGTYIAQLLPENPYQGYLPFIAQNSDSIRELAEARIVLETGAAFLIAAKATPEQIRELEAINAQLDAADDQAERLKFECELHSAMLKMAGNSVINGLIPLVVDFFHQLRNSRRQGVPRPHEEVKHDHQSMIDAIARHDGAALSEMLRTHSHRYLR